MDCSCLVHSCLYKNGQSKCLHKMGLQTIYMGSCSLILGWVWSVFNDICICFRVTIPTTVTQSSTMATVQKMTFTAAKTSQDGKHLKTFQNKVTFQTKVTIQQMRKTVLQVTNGLKDWSQLLFTKTIIATLVSSTW